MIIHKMIIGMYVDGFNIPPPQKHLNNKKVRDRSHAPKNATPIVAKQILNTKGHTLLSFKWNCVFTEFILNDKGKRV